MFLFKSIGVSCAKVEGHCPPCPPPPSPTPLMNKYVLYNLSTNLAILTVYPQKGIAAVKLMEKCMGNVLNLHIHKCQIYSTHPPPKTHCLPLPMFLIVIAHNTVMYRIDNIITRDSSLLWCSIVHLAGWRP